MQKKKLWYRATAIGLMLSLVSQTTAFSAPAENLTADGGHKSYLNGSLKNRQSEADTRTTATGSTAIPDHENKDQNNPLLSYFQDQELIVNDGNGSYNASKDLEQVKDSDEFTLTMSFKTNSKGVQTLFYIGSDEAGTNDQYFNLYLNNGKIGIEIRDGVKNPVINTPLANASNGSYHVITLSYLRNSYYKIYADGLLILNHTDQENTSRFLDSLGMVPTTMTFGKGTRITGNNYPFTGTMKNISLYSKALSEDEILMQHGVTDALDKNALISETELDKFDGETTQFDLSNQIDSVKNLEQGSIHARFRIDHASKKDNGLMTLFSVSDRTAANTYGAFYINPNTNKIGMELRENGTHIINASASIPKSISILNGWHTASYVYNKHLNQYYLYLDGELCSTGEADGFFDHMTNLNTVRCGDLSRSAGDHLWAFNGNVDLLEIYGEPFSEASIQKLHEMTVRNDIELELPDTATKTEPVSLFYAGYDGSVSYRIPSIITTDSGVVIAAIDKRQSGSGDYGNIDIAIRRSLDGGKTWGDPNVILALPDGKDRSSFLIDSSMLVDKETGEIHLLVDMMPESVGLMDAGLMLEGSGYRTVGDVRYLELRDYNNSNIPATSNVYTIRENGQVFLEQENGNSVPTSYSVPDHSSGVLLKEGKPAGNIFLYTGPDAGELKVKRTTYLWMITSRDDGLTWSKPIDLNSQVKEDWMKFLGTGPGMGIQIEQGPYKGRLVYPVYHTNSNVGGSQCSAVIYSDDHGKTWSRGESPNAANGLDPETMNNYWKMVTESQVVEVGNNGRLKILMRNPTGKVLTATSDDGGATWKNFKKDDALYDSYCQLSVIKYSKQLEYDGQMRDAYVFSNPANESIRRNDGTVRIGFYNEASDTFEWPYQQLVHKGGYQYSCLTVLPDGQIGLFYEGDVPNMRFTSFTTDWVTAKRTEAMGKPAITNITMEQKGQTLTFTVDFDQYMMKIGEPVLNLLVDGKDESAVYQSGASSKQYVFTYELKSSQPSQIIATNVSAQGNSDIGNSNNERPDDVTYKFTVN